MSRYVSQLQNLHRAVTEHAPAEGLTPSDNISIYAAGYRERLHNAVLTDYPALAHYLGGSNMRRAVEDYIHRTHSTHWDLNLYPIGFGAFVRGYFADEAAHALATLESAITEVFWLPESAPLDAGTLLARGADALGTQRLPLRHAACLLNLTHNADGYLTALRAGAALPPLTTKPERLLVIRIGNEVHRMELTLEESQLLAALDAGICLGDALTRVEDPESLATQLPEYVQRWLEMGIFRLR